MLRKKAIFYPGPGQNDEKTSQGALVPGAFVVSLHWTLKTRRSAQARKERRTPELYESLEVFLCRPLSQLTKHDNGSIHGGLFHKGHGHRSDVLYTPPSTT